MGFDREIPHWRKWDLRLQGCALCLALEALAFLAWVAYQIHLGAEAIIRFG
jgi:hypothetical protein